MVVSLRAPLIRMPHGPLSGGKVKLLYHLRTEGMTCTLIETDAGPRGLVPQAVEHLVSVASTRVGIGEQEDRDILALAVNDLARTL